MHPSDNNFSRRSTAHLILLLIIILAAILRAHDLNESFWSDEIFTFETATHTGYDEYVLLPHPLIYLLSEYSINILGETEAATRFPMFLSGLLGIAALYLLVRQVSGDIAGLIAAFVMAVSSTHVYLSQEARYYAFVVLFGIWFIHCVWLGITRGGVWPWVGTAIVTTLGIFNTPITAPFFFGVGAGASVWCLIQRNLAFKWRVARVAAMGAAGLAGLVLDGGALVAVYGSDGIQTEFFWLGGDDNELVSDDKGPSVDADRPMLSVENWRATTWTLTLPQYVSYLRYALSNVASSGNSLALSAALILAGAIAVMRRERAFGFCVLGGLVVTPLPLFLIPVSHFYVPNYFVYTLPLLLGLLAIGIVAVAGTLQLVINRMLSARNRPGPSDSDTMTAKLAYATTILVLVTLLAGLKLREVREHYDRYPKDDWKGLAARLAPSWNEGDVFVYFQDGPHRVTWHPIPKKQVDFYLTGAVGSHEPNFSVRQTHLAAKSIGDIHRIAVENPNSALWVVDITRYSSGSNNVFDESFTDFGAYGRIHLYAVGAPSENLARGGDFDTDTSRALVDVRTKGSGVIKKGEGFGSESSIEFSGSQTSGTAVAFISIDPHKYRIPNFDTMTDGPSKTAGWVALSESNNAVKIVRLHSSPEVSIELAPIEEENVLRHSVSPNGWQGNDVSFSSEMMSEAANAAGIRLTYGLDGEIKHEVALHPGDGEWRRLEVSAHLPNAASAASVVLSIFRFPRNEGMVIARRPELSRNPVHGQLLEGQTYTVSADIKLQDVIPAEDSNTFLRPGLVRLHSDSGYLFLAALKGTHDWRKYVWHLEPGIHFPAEWKTLRLYIGLDDGIGTIWVDNVQWEVGRHATLFTPDIRYPRSPVVPEEEISDPDPTPRRFSKNESIIGNGSFETRKNDGEPEGWVLIAPNRAADKTGTESRTGQFTMALKSDPAVWSIGFCNVTVPEDVQGHNLVVGAWGRVPVANQLFLSISDKDQNGKTRDLARIPWPSGNNEWQYREVSTRIPDDRMPNSLRVRISLRPGAKGVYMADDVVCVIQ